MIEGDTNGNSGITPSKTLPFSMTVSSLRRKKLLEIISTSSKIDKEEANQTVKAFSRLVSTKKEKTFDPRAFTDSSGKIGYGDFDEEGTLRSNTGEINDELITYQAGKEPSLNDSRPQLNARTIEKLKLKRKIKPA